MDFFVAFGMIVRIAREFQGSGRLRGKQFRPGQILCRQSFSNAFVVNELDRVKNIANRKDGAEDYLALLYPGYNNEVWNIALFVTAGMHSIDSEDSMNVALLVIDMQRGAYCGTSMASMDAASETIQKALCLFRERGLPVVWIQDVSGKDDSQVMDEPFDCIESLRPLATESRISKRYWNAFNKTECLSLLRSQDVDTVIVSGYCAECCVLSTYRGAMDADLTPLILRGGIASGDQENLNFVERISDSVSLSALRSLLPSRALGLS